VTNEIKKGKKYFVNNFQISRRVLTILKKGENTPNGKLPTGITLSNKTNKIIEVSLCHFLASEKYRKLPIKLFWT
jgi:hypothetical protein